MDDDAGVEVVGFGGRECEIDRTVDEFDVLPCEMMSRGYCIPGFPCKFARS